MKLVLDNGQEIILSQETSEVIMQEIENKMKPKRNFSEKVVDNDWYISYVGKVSHGRGDINGLNNLNSFTNKEYAKKISRRQYIDRLILNFIDENRVNWFNSNDIHNPKYHVFYSIQDDTIKISAYGSIKQSTWCFPTEEIAQQCLDKYRDELIEYFTMEV